MRTYEVRHCTRYRYDQQVTASYGRAYLTPRDAPGQVCRSTRLDIEPGPETVTEQTDFFGNRCTYVEVHASHAELVVTATSVVEVTRVVPELASIDDLSVADDGTALTGYLARGFVLPSPQVPLAAEVRAYAAAVFTPGRPLGQAVAALVHRIHADLEYRPGVTSVTTTLAEVLTRRAGVCQDFAHLAVGCLRSAGLPARYVSGYLETTPPPGRPRLQGADASHAWASVLLPRLGWVDLDPTNDHLVDDRYVVTAWGRDYTDVPPLKGVVFTQGSTSTLEVSVDVTLLGHT